MSKLVRDKIPQIISASGRTPKTKTINIKSGIGSTLLIMKLKEETTELTDEMTFYEDDKDRIVEEIADVLEVLDTIAFYYDIDKSEVIAMQDKKRNERGGFIDGVILMGVEK